MKIGTLLAIGYGEAGACIIANNMVDNAFTQFGKGEKKIGIFGFCDIRNFTDATEVISIFFKNYLKIKVSYYLFKFNVIIKVLQEDVMLFVNTIA